MTLPNNFQDREIQKFKDYNGEVTVKQTQVATKILFEEIGATTYIGKATPGTASSANSWQIMKLTNDEVLFANGSDLFNNVWDNRLSYTYS